jgi:predicted nucleic acid-binding protein
MSVLIDTSVWIDYFRDTKHADAVDVLIEDNLIVTNQLILAELIPPLHVSKKKNLITLLKELKQCSIAIDWDDIVQMQILCIKNGINGVGIPDLIIAQNAIQYGMTLLSVDKHFTLIAEHTPLVLYQ